MQITSLKIPSGNAGQNALMHQRVQELWNRNTRPGFIDKVQPPPCLTNFNNVASALPAIRTRAEMNCWATGHARARARMYEIRDDESVISRRKAVERLAIPRSGRRPRNLQAVQGRGQRLAPSGIAVDCRPVVSPPSIRRFRRKWMVARRWGSSLGIGNRFGEIALSRRDYVTNGGQLRREFIRACMLSAIRRVQLKRLVNAAVKLVDAESAEMYQ